MARYSAQFRSGMDGLRRVPLHRLDHESQGVGLIGSNLNRHLTGIHTVYATNCEVVDTPRFLTLSAVLTIRRDQIARYGGDSGFTISVL